MQNHAVVGQNNKVRQIVVDVLAKPAIADRDNQQTEAIRKDHDQNCSLNQTEENLYVAK
jgi:hypothetical protein